MTPAELAEYLGRGDGYDEIHAQPLRALSATLDHEFASWHEGDPVPPAWQWLYFLPCTPQSRLEPDGHPRRGESLPVSPDAQRLFAGARMTFHRPLAVGARIFRESSVHAVARKRGRTGPLLFLTLRHVYSDAFGVALQEDQDLVFVEGHRDASGPGADAAAPPAAWTRVVTPDPVMLFRFSALTFNAHRIHYDPDYTRGRGYPGLLTHGPLIAILLLDLAARRAGRRHLREFAFRARAPVIAGARIELRGAPDPGGRRAALNAYRHDGALAMSAELTFADGGGIPLSPI